MEISLAGGGASQYGSFMGDEYEYLLEGVPPEDINMV